MRVFYVDAWGKLCDHNGVIGTSDEPSIKYAVEILNEQQQQIERLKSLRYDALTSYGPLKITVTEI